MTENFEQNFTEIDNNPKGMPYKIAYFPMCLLHVLEVLCTQ